LITPLAGVDSDRWVGNTVFLKSTPQGPEGDPIYAVGKTLNLGASLPLEPAFLAALTSYGFFCSFGNTPFSLESSFKIDRLLKFN
jgi:hypothetical protein